MRVGDALISPTTRLEIPPEERGRERGDREEGSVQSGQRYLVAHVARICTVFYDITRLYVCTYVDNKKRKSKKK